LVTDLITDADDEPAQTLETYLFQHGLDAMAQDAVAEFSTFLRSSLILTKNLMPHNLVLAPNGLGHRLVLIDGLGLYLVAASQVQPLLCATPCGKACAVV
jgi:hypothetical protein